MLTEAIRQHIEDIIHQELPEAFVVDMKLHRGKMNMLRIRIDTDAGILMTECAQASRAISRWIDTYEEWDFPFTLEVTSPGVGEPLLLKRQYHKNILRPVSILLKDGLTHKGTLLQVSEESITIKREEKKKPKKPSPDDAPIPLEIIIPFSAIKESKILVNL